MPHYDIEKLREIVRQVARVKEYPQQDTEIGTPNNNDEKGKPDKSPVGSKPLTFKPLPVYKPPTDKST